jgi:hypothetical protein
MSLLNASWFENGDPKQGLNHRLSLINDNDSSENLELLQWAGEKYQLADPNANAGELRREKLLHRVELAKATAGDIDVEAYDCCLRGYGTLKEHKLYDKIYCTDLSLYVEAMRSQAQLGPISIR